MWLSQKSKIVCDSHFGEKSGYSEKLRKTAESSREKGVRKERVVEKTNLGFCLFGYKNTLRSFFVEQKHIKTSENFSVCMDDFV